MADGAYTVSKMLASINEVMAPVASERHAGVTLQRRLDNGVMLNTTPSELALLDLQAKVKHSAQQVAQLSARLDKLAWTQDLRSRGNDAFRAHRYSEAAELYVQALAGLDFGATLEERRACQRDVQVPITCNLAACLLMQDQWDKARRVCDQALEIDTNHVRTRKLRAKALTRLGRFDDARWAETLATAAVTVISSLHPV
ncbi:hypothetical protein PINS_up003547 [Pythium insidiosum]|nr:hypothetical protein PINS_up003547 [Pythium insidiosum]